MTTDDVEPAIRTPDQRLRVFVSSTLGELAPERAAVREVVERLRLVPVMFELGARPHPPRALYRTYLGQSHVFVGIYWQSYGWVAPGESVSGLEDEYLLSADLPRLLYVKDPAPERQERLTALLRRIQTEDTATYKRFTTGEELQRLLADDLMLLLTETFETALHRTPSPPEAARLVRPPEPLTPLIGREEEVRAVTDLITAGARLVTLTGTGGIGKTRLAVEVAGTLTPAFDGAVHFVSLADVQSADQFLPAAAASLRLPLDSGPTDIEPLTRLLAGRRLLLVLDNFEHLTAAAPQVAELLDRCRQVVALVTSRQPLHLRGEREYRVEPLPLPRAGDPWAQIEDSAAVRLFVDRARAVQPAFRLTEENARDVAAICARLDGVPLALELAAPRIRLLPPAMLLERLSARTDVLAGGPVDLPDRQRTLRATIEWSYRLLDERERALFARLSVFAGSFFLDAVEPVCGDGSTDVLEVLTSLLDKSLVAVPSGAPYSGPRLLMLSAVREYAADRLEERGERPDYRHRLAQFYLGLAEDFREDLVGPAHAARSERLDAEAGNVRAAVSWWRDSGDARSLGRFAWATFPHYWLRGQLREFDGMLAEADGLANPQDDDARLLLVVRGFLHVERGRATQAVDLAERLLDDSGTGTTTVAALVLEASALTAVGEGLTAREHAQRAHQAAADLHDPWLTAMAARALGAATFVCGELAVAGASFAECVAYARAAQHWPMLGASLGPLGAVALQNGDQPAARTAFQEAADAYRRSGSHEGLPFLLEQVATLGQHTDPRSATEILAAADALRQAMGIVVLPQLAAGVARLRDDLRNALGDDFDAAWQTGQDLDATAALSRAQVVLRTPVDELTDAAS